MPDCKILKFKKGSCHTLIKGGANVYIFGLNLLSLARLLFVYENNVISMIKNRMVRLTEDLYDDLEDDMGLVVPILTECDVDEDFMEGIESVGNELPILPLRNMVLFPGVAMPVMIGRQKSLRLVKEVQGKKILIGVVCQKDKDTDDPGMDDLYPVGVVAEIVRILDMPDGTTTAILQGKKRFELKEITNTEPYLKGKVELLDDIVPDKKDREFEALISTDRKSVV